MICCDFRATTLDRLTEWMRDFGQSDINCLETDTSASGDE